MTKYSRAVRFFFFRMENPFGPRGKSAIKRVTQALRLAERRAAAPFDLPGSLQVHGLVVKESTDAMLAAWRHRVPRLRAMVAGHRELIWGRGMNPVDEAHDAVNTSLQLAMYEVDVLRCEAIGGAWNDAEELCE